MRALVLFVGLVALVACRDAMAPRPFTLGPGCWTITRIVTNVGVTTLIKAHYPQCPDSLPAGQTLWHWDTVYHAVTP